MGEEDGKGRRKRKQERESEKGRRQRRGWNTGMGLVANMK